MTSRGFYDGMGHLVETRTPGPSGETISSHSWSAVPTPATNPFLFAGQFQDSESLDYSLVAFSPALLFGRSTSYRTRVEAV